jgi:hypothetical protein
MGRKRVRKNHALKKTIPKHGVHTYRIPTEEEFARADALWRERIRGFDEVCSRLMERFKSSGLHKVHLFNNRKADEFGALLFYETNRQIEEAAESGLTETIKLAAIEELVRVGRGTPETIRVDVSVDSDEQVQRDYGGNYFNRLR